jgi:hypothetical protein
VLSEFCDSAKVSLTRVKAKPLLGINTVVITVVEIIEGHDKKVRDISGNVVHPLSRMRVSLPPWSTIHNSFMHRDGW